MLALNGNWVDLVIILIVLFFTLEAVRAGFWVMLIDFASFLLSLLIALRGYQAASGFLRVNFTLGRSLANALGFLLTAIVSEAVLGFLFSKLLLKVPKKIKEFKWEKPLAILPAVGEALVLISFVLTLLLSFPIKPTLKTDINESKIGGFLVRKTAGIEASLAEVFGGVIEDSLTYLTVQPGSRESVPINAQTQELTIDEAAESEMLRLVNEERRKMGISELEWRPEVVPVARDHARDMWERQYFGHVSPEGEDVGDRLEKANVSYSFAGENLALAPTTQTAHNGLMNSEGHRENILEPRFSRVGIGVIDNGVYGKMFVQVFTD